jgi:Tfp pilus assembly protein PilF
LKETRVFVLSIRGFAPLGLALATLALAGCETTSRSASVPQVTVIEDDKQGTSAVNIASLTEVIQRNPSDPSAYNTRGAAHARVGRYPDAIADFTRAVQLDPGYAPAYTNRALAYRQTGKNDLAVADFSRAIEADPNYGPAYIGRGNLLRAQGSFPDALQDLTVAIRLTPESAEALHARGLLHQRQGNHQQALLDFDGALRGPGPKPRRDEPARQGGRGFQRGPQRQQPGCGNLGLARRRLRAPGQPDASGREFPACRFARREQRHRKAGPCPTAGWRRRAQPCFLRPRPGATERFQSDADPLRRKRV